MFFSGHIATTFLLYLFAPPAGEEGSPGLPGAAALFPVVVFFSHLHYTIDVIGAYAVTFTIFTLGDRWLCRHFPGLAGRGL